MKTTMTISGAVKFKQTISEQHTKRFVELLEKDLAFAKNKGTLNAFAIQNDSLVFTFASMRSRFLGYPGTRFMRTGDYPVNFGAFISWAANTSSGNISVNQEAGLLTVSYQLNFSELFRWTLFIFTGIMLFGLTALFWERELGVLVVGVGIILCGLYFGGGVLSGVMAMRRYLKVRMQQALRNGS